MLVTAYFIVLVLRSSYSSPITAYPYHEEPKHSLGCEVIFISAKSPTYILRGFHRRIALLIYGSICATVPLTGGCLETISNGPYLVRKSRANHPSPTSG